MAPTVRIVAATALAPITIAVHLRPATDGATAGTFVATGLVADSGTVPSLARHAGLRRRLRAPLVVHGAESLAGAGGSIALAYDGVFRPAGRGSFSGEGVWRITGGDHAYERLDASGRWAATAAPGPDGLSVDTVFDGTGALG
jgi:hypothetical protein